MSLEIGGSMEGHAPLAGNAEACGAGRQARRHRRILRRLALLVTGALTLGLGLDAAYAPGTWHVGDDFWLALLLATGTFVLIVLFGARSGRLAAGGTLVACLGVFLLIGPGYGYRPDSGDPAVRLLPPARPSVAVAASPDASYQVDATIDGAAVHFLVDTGASDVVLRLEDATRLGLDLSRLDFSDRMTTSNGVVHGAAVTLDEVKIGAVTVRHLPAEVSDGDLDVSLLGMRFLAKLAEVTIKDGVLTIRQ